MSDEKFVVRLWDYFDGWIDICGPRNKAEAQALFDEKTNNGTVKAKEDFHGGYYRIFPANTRMIWNSEVMDP